MTHKPLGQRSFETFAHRYASLAPTKPHNAYYERPATLSLLPEVEGRRVLDAGCGPGHYTRELLARGAEVVAVDVTPEMVELARAEVGDRAVVLRADLAEPLDFAADGEFALVVAPLVLDSIGDWRPVFREFSRVLEPGGHLVFSCGHPMSDHRLVRRKVDPGSDYFRTEYFAMEWTGFGEPKPTIHSYRRSLGETLNPVIEAGFVLERLVEPRPTEVT